MRLKATWVSVVILMIAVAMQAQQADQKDSPQDSPAGFTVNDANVVLEQLRVRLEDHSERKLFALFDSEKMVGYQSFREQLLSFLGHNDGIRVNIRAIQTSGEGDHGVITAMFQMETTSRDGNAVRREKQLRIELTHGDRGWLITDLDPRSFFS